eukprot:15657266-Heterocapsa_arctica.AAC.2
MVHWQGEQWRALDYGDKLPLDPDICHHMDLPVEHVEIRQCLLKATAAAVLHARAGQLPSHGRVVESARVFRTEHWGAAREAACALGENPPWVSPEARDLRVFVHDALALNHEKDFHSLAAFPHALHEELAMFVWCVSSGGDITLEALLGAEYQARGGTPGR